MKLISLQEALGLPLLFGFLSSPDSPHPELVRRGLYPPLPVLVSPARGKIERALIWGKAVLETARAFGAGSVQVREIDEKTLPPGDALLVCLLLENRQDGYSWEEMEGIADFMGKAGIADDGTIADLVSSEGGLRHIGRFRGLGEALRRLVSAEKIDLKTAEYLSSVPGAVFDELEALLDSLSFSERRIFLKTLAEIIKRDRMDQDAALTLCSGLRDSQEPLEKLHRLRYPELSSLEERFSAAAARALKGSGVTLKPPPCFEGSRYSVSFEFENGRVLKKKIRALENLAGEEDELFALL
jgi:hypothetical protein